MSVHGIQPQFKDYAGYQEWRSDWRELYAHASSEIRQAKIKIKGLQRANESSAAQQRELKFQRNVARKLMTALETAKIRWDQIKAMKRSIVEQAKEFPIAVEARNIDFHFNKKSMEFDFIPMWVVKARGKTFYVNHMDCQVPWTTRETPDHPSTKGSLRIKRGTVNIDVDGNAVIN